MSYSISISGHKATLSEGESRDFEEKILAKTREFVANLEGIQTATFSGGYIGTKPLIVEAQEG